MLKRLPVLLACLTSWLCACPVAKSQEHLKRAASLHSRNIGVHQGLDPGVEISFLYMVQRFACMYTCASLQVSSVYPASTAEQATLAA